MIHVPMTVADERIVHRWIHGTLRVTIADEDPVYWYREHRIFQDTTIPRGYYGRWYCDHYYTDCLAGCKAHIDALIGDTQ